MVTSSAGVGSLPFPFPFPPPPDEPAQELVSIRRDSALLAAGIASIWTIIQAGNPEMPLAIPAVALAIGPMILVALLGAMLGPGAASGTSVVGPSVGMAFAALYGEMLVFIGAMSITMGEGAGGAVFALLVFGMFFALLFMPIAAPCAVAWVLLLREVFGPQGSERHLAKGARRLCVALIAIALVLFSHQVMTSRWVGPDLL